MRKPGGSAFPVRIVKRCISPSRIAYVILAHLSESNNLPELARLTAERALNGRASLLANKLLLAAQNEPLAAIYF